jgi:hypothetical protein
MTDKEILEGIDGLAFGDYMMSGTAIRAAQEMVKKGDAVLILKALMLAHANGELCASGKLKYDAGRVVARSRDRVDCVYREVGDD